MDLPGHTWAILDSGESRKLAESGYNARRAECEQACELLQIASLSEASAIEMLPDRLRRRARHVLTENQRVSDAVDALYSHDAQRLGELLDAGHASLRDDYEVSTPAVEHAVRTLKDHGALGARIMGGGFGGSVLALMPPGSRLPPRATVVRASAGAQIRGAQRGTPNTHARPR